MGIIKSIDMSQDLAQIVEINGVEVMIVPCKHCEGKTICKIAVPGGNKECSLCGPGPKAACKACDAKGYNVIKV